MQQMEKEYRQKRHLQEMLERLREGVAIVEGKHDVAVLERLGVHALVYSAVESGKSAPEKGKTIYILTDNDKGGDEKRERLKSALLAMDIGHAINEELGRKLLQMLGATSIEQIYGPAMEILEEEKSDNHGKNISRHSKIYGRG